MITAEKALKLVRTSVVHIPGILIEIDKQITEAATDGKRQYKCLIQGMYSSMPVEQYFYGIQMSVDQQLVSQKLWDRGFNVELGKYDSEYLPVDSSLLATKPTTVIICLTISW